ncbi:MAG: filamentous hemagglutinin N-terminal domain-containing protein, partial [Armatimonadetes bacterium]|nr:filamentous hemagglutinin N-terminal domain-containing protein [Armatimonadota bacterium]
MSRTAFALLLTGLCSLALAAPEGGNVVAGQAAISKPDALTTSILQSSQSAIINWKGFSIDVNELVKFLQPNAGAVALNRVTGIDPSTILGELLANGRVFLVNPNGILFGPHSKVDVGSLLATTFDLKDSDFLAGKYEFLQKPGAKPAFVVNQGQIKVAKNGAVFLVAPGVKNEGLIIAQLGTVALGSGGEFKVRLRDDGPITYCVAGKVLESVVGPDGKP